MRVALAAACVLVVILLALTFFHRRPTIRRNLNNVDQNYVLSPAYGTLKDIKVLPDYIHFIIFLSPLDIHRQYYPCAGTIKSRTHDNTGKYYLAYELDKSSDNDKIITEIDTPNGIIIVKQIAGWLARCLVSYDQPGDEITAGAEMGMIEFGSRVDILVPRERFTQDVTPGTYLRGPDTTLGYFEPASIATKNNANPLLT